MFYHQQCGKKYFSAYDLCMFSKIKQSIFGSICKLYFKNQMKKESNTLFLILINYSEDNVFVSMFKKLKNFYDENIINYISNIQIIIIRSS